MPVDFPSFLSSLNSLHREIDKTMVEKAYHFAEMSHTGQTRYSGEPYIIHPIATAKILADWGMGTTSIVAGLLHDTVEDGAATTKDIEEEFGSDVSTIVDGVTKISNIKLRGSLDDQFIENLRKMIIAMSKDLRVVIVKLADRLHNMQTLKYVPKHKQKRIARETIEIYAPLADRMEMGQAKGALEDLAFPFLYPQDYQWLIKYSAPHYKKTEKTINQAIKTIHKKLITENIKAEVQGRKKGLYSLYKKLLRPENDKNIEKISDLIALRIIVDTVPQCYTALGVVHKMWKPSPKHGLSDYIAQPKPNGYQSLHTKVFINHKISEIQIRTQKMHQEAEYGIAAHFNYSDAKQHGANDKQLEKGVVFADQKKLNWVKQLVDLHKEIKSNQELITNLKHDILSDRIFVFTPKGDVIDLPKGATPIDFAFNIHTKLGKQIAGAKVNSKLVALDHHLKSGDICEIIKSKNVKKPNKDWLMFVVTNTARQNINKQLKEKALT